MTSASDVVSCVVTGVHLRPSDFSYALTGLLTLALAAFLLTFAVGLVLYWPVFRSPRLVLEHGDISLRLAAFQIAAWFLWDVALLGRLAPLPAVAAWLPGWIYDGVSKCGLTLASGEVLVASVVLVALGEVLLINSFLVCEYFASQAWLRDTDFPCGSLARKSAAEGTSANASPPRPTGLPRRLTAVGDDGILSSDRFPDSPDAPAGAADPDRVPGPPGQRASFSTTRRTAKRPRHARTRSDVPAAASDASDSSPPHLSGLLRRAQTLAGKLKCAQGLRRHGRQLAVLVVSLGGVLAAASGALVLAAVLALQGACVRTLFLFLGAACAVVSANCTHGLGGWLRWRAPGLLTPGSWRFFQPFRGGRFFMATQGAGWTLFSAGLFGMMVAGRMAAVGAVRWLHHVSLATAAAVIAAQVLLAVSIFRFQVTLPRAKRAPEVDRGRGDERMVTSATVLEVLESSAVICVLWALPHVLVALLFLPFLFLPWRTVLVLHASWMIPYSIVFGVGPDVDDFHLGRRNWPALHEWWGRALTKYLPLWLGSVRIISDANPANHPPGRRLIFAYHPHGLVPVGAGIFHFLPDFSRLFPGIRPALLAASVIFSVPLLRDVLSWFRGRPVRRRTFAKALQTDGAVVVVPGGQQELVWASRALGREKEVVLVSHHVGFLKMAVLQRAAVVPTLCFGEIINLRNIVQTPELHQWTYKYLGFPVPFVIVGKLGVLPLPDRIPFTFVLGEAMPPPPCPDLSRHLRSVPVVSSAPEGALFAAAAEAKASAGLGGAGGEGNGGVGKEQGGGGEDLGMDETSPSCSVSDWSGDESDGELEDGGNRVAAREGAGSGTCSVLGGDGGGDDAPSNGCGAHWGLGAGPGGRDLTQAEMRRVWNAPELGAVVEEFRKAYFEKVVELFDKHKAAAGYADFSVRLVDKKNVLGKKSTAAEDKKTQ